MHTVRLNETQDVSIIHGREVWSTHAVVLDESGDEAADFAGPVSEEWLPRLWEAVLWEAGWCRVGEWDVGAGTCSVVPVHTLTVDPDRADVGPDGVTVRTLAVLRDAAGDVVDEWAGPDWHAEPGFDQAGWDDAIDAAGGVRVGRWDHSDLEPWCRVVFLDGDLARIHITW